MRTWGRDLIKSHGLIRTVVGDVPADTLGVCDAHDHLFLRTPALPGEELDDVGAATEEVSQFARVGGGWVVQWTPAGMGRMASALAAISRGTGIHIVAATGMHQERHYAHDGQCGGWPADLDPDDLTDLFIDELVGGIREDTGPHQRTSERAGIIKVAVGYRSIDSHEARALTAAAAAHQATGAPVCVHLELGTHGVPVADALISRGVDAGSIVIGHVGRHPEVREHLELASRGVFLAYDGPSRTYHDTDWRLLQLLTDVSAAGYGGQLMVGGDCTRRSARAATGGAPGMSSLLTATRVAITEALGAEASERIFVSNPQAAYAWRGSAAATPSPDRPWQAEHGGAPSQCQGS